METLWAPWRMVYLEDHTPQAGCVFCTKAQENQDEQNLILYRAPECFVIMNLYPYNSGHLMVVPYQHAGQWTALHPRIGAEVFAVSQLAISVLEKSMGPQGFNIGVNQGKVSGAGVADHIHLHIVPRWNGDTNFMPVLADTKVMPELLHATAAKLRPLFEAAGRGE